MYKIQILNKTNMKKRIFTSCICTLLVVLSMISCRKDSLLENGIAGSQLSKDVFGAKFSNMDDYNKELENVLSMDKEKLSEWQKQQSYNSFGIECDLFYSQINPELFNSQNEIFEFVRKNEKYIRLVVDKNGDMIVENQLENHPNKYFISDEKIFRIAGTAYKCYNEGMISTKIENIEKLRKIENMKMISNTKSNDSIFSVQYFTQQIMTKSNYGRYLEDQKDDNRDRTKFWIQLSYTEDASNSTGSVITTYTIQPLMKTLGIYFGCFRTLSANVRVAYNLHHTDFYYPSQNVYKIPSLSGTYQGTEPENKKTITLSRVDYKGKLVELSFCYSDSWAGNPSTPRCIIQRDL